MSWAQTDFGKLKSLSKDFYPYFAIATLAKNYQLHIEQYTIGSFMKIKPLELEK